MGLIFIQLLSIELVMVIAGLFLGYKCIQLRKNNMYYFFEFVAVLDLFLLINIPIRMSELRLVIIDRNVLFVLYALSVILMTFTMAHWFLFDLKQIGSRLVNTKTKATLCFIPVFFSVFLCIANYWTGWLYEINANSEYIRGSAFVLQALVSYVYFFVFVTINICHLVTGREKRNVQKCFAATLPAVIGTILQIICGESYLLLGTIIGAWYIYVEICLDRQKAYELSEAISAINDELIHSNTEVTKNVKTIMALSDIYYIMYEVDFKNDTFKEIKAPQRVSDVCSGFTKASECLNAIPGALFVPQYVDTMQTFFDYESINEALKNTNSYYVDAIGIFTNSWIRTTVIEAERDDEGNISCAVFTVQEIGEIIEQQKKAEEAKAHETQALQMRELFVQTTEALAGAIDAKDRYTHGHSVRVAEYSRKMAELAGKSFEECEEIYFAGLLHDVGKIGIADNIINKEGKLTDDEYAEIKKHPATGKGILSSIDKLPYLSIGANSHHERYDGHGYPEGMKGTDIPELARIIAVADSYDAMTSKRSYRDPLAQITVREELIRGAGTQFDPVYAKLMVQLIDEDVDYQMKERVDVEGFSGNEELFCTDFGKEYSEGIAITPFKVRMHFTAKKDKVNGGLPSIIVFDAMDGRIHKAERDQINMGYTHFCDIRVDGLCTEYGARKYEVNTTGSDDPVETATINVTVDAVKWRDHLYITVSDGHHTTEATVVLPDSTFYAYFAVSGERCHIYDVDIEKDEQIYDVDSLKRIAEEISYIDGPEGDIPNVQINGWRFANSQAIPLEDKLDLSFHMKSLPGARLVWHLPYVIIFSADDAQMGGENYREFAFIRFDGESWQDDPCASNRLIVNYNEEFTGWDDWKVGNKAGRDCELSVVRNDNQLIMTTECGGIELKNFTTIEGEIPKLYLAFSGDQCVIENIHIIQ